MGSSRAEVVEGTLRGYMVVHSFGLVLVHASSSPMASTMNSSAAKYLLRQWRKNGKLYARGPSCCPSILL